MKLKRLLQDLSIQVSPKAIQETENALYRQRSSEYLALTKQADSFLAEVIRASRRNRAPYHKFLTRLQRVPLSNYAVLDSPGYRDSPISLEGALTLKDLRKVVDELKDYVQDLKGEAMGLRFVGDAKVGSEVFWPLLPGWAYFSGKADSFGEDYEITVQSQNPNVNSLFVVIDGSPYLKGGPGKILADVFGKSFNLQWNFTDAIWEILGRIEQDALKLQEAILNGCKKLLPKEWHLKMRSEDLVIGEDEGFVLEDAHRILSDQWPIKVEVDYNTSDGWTGSRFVEVDSLEALIELVQNLD